MSELKCTICGKQYKREAALKKHIEKEHPDQDDIDFQEEVESEVGLLEDENTHEEIEPSSNEDSTIISELKRLIEKLKVSINSCYDAQTKHRLEMELKDLQSKLEEANKS